MLKEATKKEINTKDNSGMTPVLWAAFEGKLDALRMLTGRGGNPDKSDQFGNTALHLAAAKGHLACVDFLVKFGANIFALDIDNHNPQQLAAINNRDEILRYLDAAAAHLEVSDKKKANGFKEKAKKHSEKRIKEFMKRQQKSDDEIEPKSTMLKSMKQKFWTGSHGNLSNIDTQQQPNQKETFSVLVGTGGTIVQRGAAQRKIQALRQMRQANTNMAELKFENNEAALRSFQRDADIHYVRAYENMAKLSMGGNPPPFAAKYGTLSRCKSQPDILNSSDREDAGSQKRVSFIKNTGTNHFVQSWVFSAIKYQDIFNKKFSFNSSQFKQDLISNAEHFSTCADPKGSIRGRQQLISDSEDSHESEEVDDETIKPYQPLRRFLTAYSLKDFYEIFLQQQIDLETLMLLTEDDLKLLNIPLGPYRRLIVAINERKQALNNPMSIIDTNLWNVIDNNF